MNVLPRPYRRPLALGLAILVVLAGCAGSGTSSGEPSATASTPALTPASPAASPSPTAPSSPTPSPRPTPTSSPAGPSAAACTLPTPGPLASDTLVDAVLERTSSGARLVFTFGDRPPEAVAQPTLTVVFDKPPFSMAGSGQPVTVTGDRFLMVRMNGMVIGRPNGDPVYQGERDLRLAGGTIPEAVLVDEFEGVVSWIVGLDGPGCPTVTRGTSGERTAGHRARSLTVGSSDPSTDDPS